MRGELKISLCESVLAYMIQLSSLWEGRGISEWVQSVLGHGNMFAIFYAPYIWLFGLARDREQ